MAKQSKAQKDTVERVMHAFKDGDLETAAGQQVEDRRQAVAIALSESGSSNRQSPAENRRRLKAATAREADAGGNRPASGTETKAALYEEAKRRKVPGRSTMSKSELEQALRS